MELVVAQRSSLLAGGEGGPGRALSAGAAARAQLEVWWALSGAPELLISLTVSQLPWLGTMRLWVCIALLSTVLCASADRPRIVDGIIRAGQFVRDAAGGKLCYQGPFPQEPPPQAQLTSSQWCSPQSMEIRSSTLEIPWFLLQDLEGLDQPPQVLSVSTALCKG